MIALLQRVKNASVCVDEKVVGCIGQGILVLLGVEANDDLHSMQKLANKVANYRIFSDEQGKMNLNVQQIDGEVLVVSQFTLMADTKKGNRPSFSNAGDPVASEVLYESFIGYLKEKSIPCHAGQFGADMQVTLTNDGPVTFWLQV